MLQVLGWSLLAILVAGGLCGLAVVFLPAGEQIAPVVRDEPVWQLPPDRGLQAEDVDSVRLPVALRGYRFAETDLLLDRLAEEIRSRDVTIAQLSRAVEEPALVAGTPTDASDVSVVGSGHSRGGQPAEVGIGGVDDPGIRELDDPGVVEVDDLGVEEVDDPSVRDVDDQGVRQVDEQA